jgi:hypothetical protein
MYKLGLDLEVVGSFRDHDGFDGTMLGSAREHYHFEFTSCRMHPVQPTPTEEDLLVFYLPEAEISQQRCINLLAAGFREVPSFNPYWDRSGRTFEDRDGYRLVIQRAAWTNAQASERG